MDIKILVASHKDSPMPKDKMYLPVLVGADKNYNGQKGFQPDNQGNDISSKNPNYNELTAIYWAWKNLHNVDAIGLVHYRRLFSKGHARLLENVLTENQVIKMLEKAPVILPRKRHYFVETIKSHYIHSHYQEPLDVTREVIKKDFPDYLCSFDNVMKSRSAHMFNMFIMKTDYFDDYCEWLFSILNKVESKIDISEYSVQEARVFGYLSELLMDVWIQKNNVKYTECNWIQIGDRHLIKKAFGFIKRKLSSNVGKDETHY
ncbi:exopolysaccharide biosynthesis protein [Fructilactobacillus lindneri]|uniref:Lipopolysaccharide biosynthesis glycosyltransferase n=2 Tax=Fructilactobacillus lindneri TaxID=53444 RepID=A0A0R2JXJ9_9LACO|nr:DUF4422 domain-containing protein [Fructilactobacillus lindneri]ANZ57747.1 exopolysaccharide biosynthesis protein [Fructilactobacillus lindneri]ANZ59016.1 exopolysaccharide biosynthesis protein [Fructilactobacillus lindneri]KRN78813.1 lipopolysaccharide biosynthesis glycosyltransferase [Fructilactobacillus lindneri DSM 20690 = JCM 11027]POG98043.1 exopolysaccharide biosynthesis protein [Fructilactobacillus lindneri]POG99060.1 exopolysaccharide biosynthesis protein [Fructilactobacillus lindn